MARLPAYSGNDKIAVEFPASDDRVMAIGGSDADGTTWDWADDPEECPCERESKPPLCEIYDAELQERFECGSNYGSEQDLVAPAKNVLSTVYTGRNQNTSFHCGDTVLDDTENDGHGVCTGTSMASPYVAGIAGLLRSSNPLLRIQAIRDILITTASHAAGKDPQL